MKPRLVVYPYKMGSAGGKAIAESLKALRVHPDKDYHVQDGDYIIDWGNGYRPSWASEVKQKDCVLLNHWDAVSRSVNKIDSFTLLKRGGVPTPPWTTSHDQALKWSKAGHMVCCRTSVEGMDGAGLVLAKEPNDVVYANLYTRYMPIDKEFRAYVFKDRMLDLREKRRDSQALREGKVNEFIRTTSGNWVFCREHIKVPKDIEQVSVAAVKALGLDFAGVDVIQAKEDGNCYVLETNTAPYVGDITVARLSAAIQAEFAKFSKQK